MDWGTMIASIVVSLVLTMFGYLFVPTVLALSGKKYEVKKLKRINIINCVVVWMLFRVLQAALGNDPTSGAAVFIWGSVGYGILKKNCLKEICNNKQITTPTTENRVCLCDEGVSSESNAFGTNLTVGANVVLSGEINPSYKSPVRVAVHRKKTENTENQDSSKQYLENEKDNFEIQRTSSRGGGQKAALIILGILLVFSVAFNLLVGLAYVGALEEMNVLEQEKTNLKVDIHLLEEKNASLEKTRDTFYDFYKQNSEKVSLVDSWVVFVEDDGTRLYHKYECEKFLWVSAWAHNIEYAEYLGYKPCPLCYE